MSDTNGTAPPVRILAELRAPFAQLEHVRRTLEQAGVDVRHLTVLPATSAQEAP